MSEDKLKKLIEAGITAEDIERELAKRAQAPKKKITKKIEPQQVTVEVKTIKPESIPDKKEDEFIQFLRNEEARKKDEPKTEYGDKDYAPGGFEYGIDTDTDPELEKWNKKWNKKYDYFYDNFKKAEAKLLYKQWEHKEKVKLQKKLQNVTLNPEVNRIF